MALLCRRNNGSTSENYKIKRILSPKICVETDNPNFALGAVAYAICGPGG